MKKQRVVITGIGPFTSLGIGKEDFWQNVLKQKKTLKPIPEEFEKTYSFKSKFYIPLPEFNMEEYSIPVMYSRIMQPEDKMTVVAASLALKDAGYSLIEDKNVFRIKELENSSIILGTGFSGLETAFKSYLAHLFSEGQTPLPQTRYNRMVIPMMMPNSPAAWVSIFFCQHGSSHTINAACASGTIAVGEAFRRVQNGYDKVVITGGVECLQDDAGAIMRGFDILNTLTRSEDGMPIPFSEKRSGFLFSEGGAAVLILEEYEHAQQRNALIYAEIEDYHSLSDAYNIVQMEKSGKKVIKLLLKLKGNKKIDYFNAHGTGTQPNDSIEAHAINEVFGKKEGQPIINSSKSILGHSIGASGAIEAAISGLSIKDARIHGNTVPEPMENINLALSTIEHPIEYAISTSYGFGGHFGGLLFKRCK